MKYVISVSDKKVLLDDTQLAQLSAVLGECEFLEEKYIGANQGTYGDSMQYKDVLNQVPTRGWLNVLCVNEDYYDALKLVQRINK
jgi:hypothetical protein